MNNFDAFTSIAAPLDRANVDTDQIIPKQFLKSIKRTGFGQHLFDQWRYLDEGVLGQDCKKRPINTEFVLNKKRFKDCEILLTRHNFGCGSSREHAPWAIREFGIRALIGPSFADIFYNNCFKNSILPIILPGEIVDHLHIEANTKEAYRLTVDLKNQRIETPFNESYNFEIDHFKKECLINGWGDIELTMRNANKISIFEKNRKNTYPWLSN